MRLYGRGLAAAMMKNERGTLRSLGREVDVRNLEHDQSRRAI
jgi:hypothetical protein